MKSLLLTGAAALALCVGGAAQAASSMSAIGAHGIGQPTRHALEPGLTTLYDQNFASGTSGFFSQTLSSYPQYDEFLADDFTVPAATTWKVKEVDVTGFYYVGAGPASSVNVLFWKNKKNLPSGTTGLVVCDNITPKAGLSTGAFVLKLPRSCAVKLKGGTSGKTYWVTVQANMVGLSQSGYWAWTVNNVVNGNMAAGYWYGGKVSTLNPLCNTEFQSFLTCTGTTYDLSFALYGTAS